MNVLIVESENDQYFIEVLIKNISDTNIYKIDDYKHSSLDEAKLTLKIKSVLEDVYRGVSKIGIILDMDDSNKVRRIALVNKCLNKAFSDLGYAETIELMNVNEFVSYKIDDYISINIACFFTNIDGQGELETVLWKIKSKPSVFADCLRDNWLNCLKSKDKVFSDEKNKPCDISEKELLKLQVDFYKRFDTLKRKDRDEKNTDWKGIMTGITKRNDTVNARGKDIFDLEHDKLNEIKTFLRLFN